VAFAGEPGAFAEDALTSFFRGAVGVPVAGFREVFVALHRDAAASEAIGADGGDFLQSRSDDAVVAAGVLPIENLVTGTVREVYDLLLEFRAVVAGEVIVPVRLCLAALPGERLESIERVYSHVQALAQAEPFLRSRPWDLITTYNTAGSGKLIRDREERGSAAVLSPRAARLFGLGILAEGIEADPDNRTRFLVVTPAAGEGSAVPMVGGGLPDEWVRRPASPLVRAVPMRTTLVLGVPNEPGSLHRCLAVFASAGLNMSKLESRPSREGAWEYVFWVDLDADVRSAAARIALAELAGVASMVRVLGSYPRAQEPA
jgi:prephenate dehydratase